jgi:hypothetical protein
MPLPYESFISRIEKQLAVEGMKISEERLALAKEGHRLFGLLALQMPGIEWEDYGCVLGLRTSYDRSFANGVCIGAAVFVCDNLSFSGEVTFERKHTANMLRDLSWMIAETVSSLPARFAAQSNAFEQMKRQELSEKDAHDLVVRFFDAGAIGVLEIPKLIKEWREPRHKPFADSPKSAWRMFNAATETIKGDLWRLPTRTRAIHTILDEVCGLQQHGNGKAAISTAPPEPVALTE